MNLEIASPPEVGVFDLHLPLRGGDERRAMLERVQAHPRWSSIGQTDQARIRILVAHAEDAATGVLTSQPVREIASRFDWTRGQTQLALKALREHGIAYAQPRWKILADGRPHQVASVYRLTPDGITIPQAKRPLTRAQKRGAKRGAVTRRRLRRQARKRHLAHRPCP